MLTKLIAEYTVIVKVGEELRCPVAGCNTKVAESLQGVAWFMCRSCKAKVMFLTM